MNIKLNDAKNRPYAMWRELRRAMEELRKMIT